MQTNHDVKKIILEVLQAHKTRELGIRRADLLKQVNEKTYFWHKVTDEELRATVAEMVMDDEILIGTSERYGYFLILTAIDKQESVDGLRQKAAALCTRANIIERIWGKIVNEGKVEHLQPSLDLKIDGKGKENERRDNSAQLKTA